MHKRIILASDIHNCHDDYYSFGTENRMNYFVDCLIAENEKAKLDAIILLGDYSLDHWAWQIKGCYINEGKSYTADFAEKYLSRLKAALPGVKLAMTAGNHEQYGEELWQKLTGYKRNDVIVLDGYVIIILDTFAGNLDPTEHSDGTYTSADVQRIRKIMNEHPNDKIILTAHFFDPAKETAEFTELCCDERILCLFCGHNHKWTHTNPNEFAGKKTIYTGNFSYNGINVERPMWGYRELVIDSDELTSKYIATEVTLTSGEKRITYPRETHDEITIKL